MKLFALCIHDLRVSDGEKILETIFFIREFFKTGLITIHLILDKDFNNDEVIHTLKKEVENNRIEIVFHGITHLCPAGTWKLLAWYHKYQAEFVSKTFNVEVTRNRYNTLNEKFQNKTGICPPCWITSGHGREFIKSLSPLYIENLLSINFINKRILSLPVSLASNNKTELFFLKSLASLIQAISGLFNQARLRLVIHTIDLSNNDSLTFLFKKYSMLISKGFLPVLQKDLR